MGKILMEYVLKFKQSKGDLSRIVPYVSFFETPEQPPYKKWSFPLRISSLNVTKSAVSFSHLLKKSLMENFMFCTVNHVVFPAFLTHICSYLTSVCVFVCEKFLIDIFLESLCSGYHYRKVSMNKVKTYLLWSFQIMLAVCQAFAIVKTLVNNYRYLIIRHNALSTAQKNEVFHKIFLQKIWPNLQETGFFI